jgi:transcriptional regulator with XRE-family HTH domain
MKTQSRLFREIRKSRGIPVNVLALKAGVSVATIVAFEKHGIPPKRRETRKRLAKALGVSYKLLFPEDSEKEVSEA